MIGLLGFLAFGIYIYFGWRFWAGFRRTNFSRGRIGLTLFWPAFLLVNKSYRENFGKALKG